MLKTVVLNRVKTVTWSEYKEGHRAEAMDETVDEGGYEGVYETGLKAGTEQAYKPAIGLAGGLAVERAGGEQQQQQPAVAAVLSVLSAPKTQDKPESTITPDTAPPSPALVLARKFWEHLGSPAKFSPASWEKGFAELVLRYSDPVDLEHLLHQAFDGFLSKKWRNRLLQAEHPLAYLRSVLSHIEDDLEDYRTKNHAILAAQGTCHPPDPATPPRRWTVEELDDGVDTSEW
ncbi:MAG: hypothetical protein ACLQOO_09485 [Terriglobia bacterium]